LAGQDVEAQRAALGAHFKARIPALLEAWQVAIAADSLGYEGVLIPTGRSCEDSWVVASSLAPFTERLKFLVAIRPGIISPTVSARAARVRWPSGAAGAASQACIRSRTRPCAPQSRHASSASRR